VTDVAIGAWLFDLDGHIRIRPRGDDSLGPIARRVNRVATLNGGAAFNDFGYSASDMTLTLQWQPRDRSQSDRMARIFQVHSLVRVCQGNEVWLAVPERYTPAFDRATASFLVREKLA